MYPKPKPIGIDTAVLYATLDALQLSVVVLDGVGTVVATNEAWRRLAQARGATAADAPPSAYLGLNYLEAHWVVCGDMAHDTETLWQKVQAVLAGRCASFQSACTYLLPTGTRHLHLNVTPLGGGHSGAVVTYRDVTEQKRHEAELQDQADHDPLTGLPNRRLFALEAGKALALAERHGHEFTLLYLDLDGFKAVNDTNGHAVGDEVLCQVATRLKSPLRESDLVARLGGDEFLILLQETEAGSSLSAAKRYQQRLEQPFDAGGHTIRLRGSIGLAHYPRHGRTLDELVRVADRAMYRAKETGGGIQVYT